MQKLTWKAKLKHPQLEENSTRNQKSKIDGQKLQNSSWVSLPSRFARLVEFIAQEEVYTSYMRVINNYNSAAIVTILRFRVKQTY